MLKAVLFDVDGTLAETEEFHRRAFNLAFTEQALDVNWCPEEYRQLLRVSGGKERLTRYFRNIRMVMPEERVRAIHAAKNALYGRDLAAGVVRLRPGVLRLISEARAAGLQLGIATTTSVVNLGALLQPLLGAAGSDWSSLFDGVVAGDQVAKKKAGSGRIPGLPGTLGRRGGRGRRDRRLPGRRGRCTRSRHCRPGGTEPLHAGGGFFRRRLPSTRPGRARTALVVRRTRISPALGRCGWFAKPS